MAIYMAIWRYSGLFSALTLTFLPHIQSIRQFFMS